MIGLKGPASAGQDACCSSTGSSENCTLYSHQLLALSGHPKSNLILHLGYFIGKMYCKLCMSGNECICQHYTHSILVAKERLVELTN